MHNGIYEIDLHGLTMSDAKMVLDEVFEYVQSDKEITEVRIVVGVGNGSETGPVLPAYVGNYLKDKEYGYTNTNGVIYLKKVQIL